MTYDRETGIVWWKASGTRHQANTPVGTRGPTGQLCVGLKYQRYVVHRVIWVLETGEDPGHLVVDHINRDPSDNRWCNLRIVPQNVNLKNSKARVKSAKAVAEGREVGVYLVKSMPIGGRRYQVKLWDGEKYALFGGHKTLEEANAVAIRERAKIVAARTVPQREV